MAKKTARPASTRPATMKRWHQALDHPEVRKRFEFWSSTIGELPPHCFMLALLNEWDIYDRDCKEQALLDCMGCRATPERACIDSLRSGRKARKVGA